MHTSVSRPLNGFNSWVIGDAVLPANVTPTLTSIQLAREIAYRPDLSIQYGTIEFAFDPPKNRLGVLPFR